MKMKSVMNVVIMKMSEENENKWKWWNNNE